VHLRKRSRRLCYSNGQQRLCGSLLEQLDAARYQWKHRISPPAGAGLHHPLRTLLRWTAVHPGLDMSVVAGPILLPFPRALGIPALTRSTIKLCSSSATAPKTETVEELGLQAQELRARRERLCAHVFNFGAVQSLGAFRVPTFFPTFREMAAREISAKSCMSGLRHR
jgi:hypothetical protein